MRRARIEIKQDQMKHDIPTNMGSTNKKEIEAFAKMVLDKRGLKDWKMKWSECGGGECIHDLKIFTIPVRMKQKYPWEAKEYVLHEMAHIFQGYMWGHGKEFYKAYADLLKEFMIIKKIEIKQKEVLNDRTKKI